MSPNESNGPSGRIQMINQMNQVKPPSQ